MKIIEKAEERTPLKSLSETIVSVMKEGYNKNFMANEKGLLDLDSNKLYRPFDVKITSFYRFEGESDPGDNAILYAIETKDGEKGILTDSYGPYSDIHVGNFIMEVEEISKKPHLVKTKWININTIQRAGSIAGGAFLLIAAAYALRGRKKKQLPILPLLEVISAGFFIHRGISGHCAFKALVDKNK